VDVDPLKNIMLKYHHKFIHFQLFNNTVKFEDIGPISSFFYVNVTGPLAIFNNRSVTSKKIIISDNPFKPYYEKQPSLFIKIFSF